MDLKKLIVNEKKNESDTLYPTFSFTDSAKIIALATGEEEEKILDLIKTKKLKAAQLREVILQALKTCNWWTE